MQLRRPFRPLANGRYRVRLGRQEREALGELCAELRPLVAEGDGAVAHPFPPAYRDDPEASDAFAELVALRAVLASIEIGVGGGQLPGRELEEVICARCRRWR